MLASLIDKLESDEKAHKEKFRVEKLVDIFHNANLDYSFEKLNEGIVRDDYAELAYGNLELISDIAEKFRETLGKRDMDFYERLQDEYELIDCAIKYLRKYFQSESNTEKPAARIYVMFLQKQFSELQKRAKEIDDEYAK